MGDSVSGAIILDTVRVSFSIFHSPYACIDRVRGRQSAARHGCTCDHRAGDAVGPCRRIDHHALGDRPPRREGPPATCDGAGNLDTNGTPDARQRPDADRAGDRDRLRAPAGQFPRGPRGSPHHRHRPSMGCAAPRCRQRDSCLRRRGSRSDNRRHATGLPTETERETLAGARYHDAAAPASEDAQRAKTVAATGEDAS